MPAQSRSSDPEDPLEGYSGLSLFPRTLASVSNASKPCDSDDLHLVHDFLVSMPLKSPSKILGQAKAIVGGSSGLPESEIPSHPTEKDENEFVDAKVKENPQERRRGLGRKRARFSLKPNSSQPIVNLEPTLDIDKLKDPEDFFLAFEKLENAKRELQKQTGGVLMDLNQENRSMAARPRRPGILGRSVRYKHQYSNVTSYQETLKENIIDSLEDSVQQETTILGDASQEREVADAELEEKELAGECMQLKKKGSIVKPEKRVNDLLDELLACSYEDLDGHGAVNLLQEQLQIKPIDVDKLCLPDLQDVRRIGLKASGANLPKPRTILSDIQNMLKGIISKSPKKRQAESSAPSQASPTPVKSPLSSIVSLKRRLFQSSPLSDPFSSLNFDQSTAEKTSPFKSIVKRTGQDNMEKELAVSPKLKSPIIAESDIAEVNMNLPEMATKDVTHLSYENGNNNLSRLGSGVNVGSNGFHADVESTVGDSCVDNGVVNEILARPDTDTDIHTNKPNEWDGKATHSSDKTEKDSLSRLGSDVDVGLGKSHDGMGSDIGDCCVDNVVVNEILGGSDADTALQMNEENKLSDKMEDMQHEVVDFVQPDCNMEDSTVENLNYTRNQASPPIAKDRSTHGHPKIADTVPEQHNKEVQKSTAGPSNEQSKAISRPHKRSRREEVTRRKSLAASGTSWESGIRRSTRIRSRPLEYWKGERFLYGRVHQSLATVIGIKYESPGTNEGKPGIKVKSFVSDQFKDLVDLAARY